MDRRAFFDRVRADLFHGFLRRAQVDGLTLILDEWERRGLTDLRLLAYMLATTFRETAETMQPIEEIGRGKGRPYGLPTGPWHQVYDGRGDVQLTWQANYRKATDRLHALGLLAPSLDLERTPELAMQPDIAVTILIVGMLEGWFTGHKLGAYFTATIDDPVGARHVINGTDRDALIASYHGHFLSALKAAALPAVGQIATAPGSPVLNSIISIINQAAADQSRSPAGLGSVAVAPTAPAVPPSGVVILPVQPTKPAETWGEWAKRVFCKRDAA